jgi:DNA-binding MarR family transcriptional regulator
MMFPGVDGEAPRNEEGTRPSLREVEEQISILSGKVKTTIRNAAAAIDPALPPFGLRVLRLVERCGPIHAGAAAEAMSVDRTVISRQSRQLEELGLVTTRADPEDRRARFIELTPLARERMSAAGPAGFAQLERMFGSWEDEDLHRFAAYLARWVDDWDALES